jgi:hypothetical protein
MVRRWSYINNINTLHKNNFRSLRKVAFDANMNSTMYLRKEYSRPTLLTRKGWARRKHLHNWLYSSNVLKDWARTYRFYRNYNKYTLNLFFTKNSFIAFNTVSLKNTFPALYKGSELVVTSSVTAKTISYFSNLTNFKSRWLTLKNLGYLNLLSAAYDVRFKPDCIQEPSTFILPLLKDYFTSLEPMKEKTSKVSYTFSRMLKTLLLLIFSFWLQNLKTIYNLLLTLLLKY